MDRSNRLANSLDAVNKILTMIAEGEQGEPLTAFVEEIRNDTQGMQRIAKLWERCENFSYHDVVHLGT
jgi:hypothetical protein